MGSSLRVYRVKWSTRGISATPRLSATVASAPSTRCTRWIRVWPHSKTPRAPLILTAMPVSSVFRRILYKMALVSLRSWSARTVPQLMCVRITGCVSRVFARARDLSMFLKSSRILGRLSFASIDSLRRTRMARLSVLMDGSLTALMPVDLKTVNGALTSD